MGNAIEWEPCKDLWGGDHQRPRGITDFVTWMDGSITTREASAVVHADTFPVNVQVYPDISADTSHFLRYVPLPVFP